MTQTRSVTIWCDHHGDGGEPCVASYGQEIQVSTAARLREMAAREGWTNDGARDYCPEHSDA
jgi:hypothetical protein